MKSRKVILIGILVVASFIGFAAIQEDVVDGSALVEINESPSEVKTITVGLNDGVGSGDKG